MVATDAPCIDTHARARIRTHERLCGERWESAREEMQEVKRALDRLFARWWWLVGVIVTAQGALILYLLDRAFG